MLVLLSAPLWHDAASNFLRLEQRTSTPLPEHQDSSFHMEDIVFRQIKQGADELLLHAKLLRGADVNKEINLENAAVNRLGPNPFSITSGRAHYAPDQAILTMLDDVLIQTADLVVKTQAMRYLTKFATFKGATEVELIGQGFNINGTSFMYKYDSGDLRVGKRVNFLYTPPTPPATKQAPSVPSS